MFFFPQLIPLAVIACVALVVLKGMNFVSRQAAPRRTSSQSLSNEEIARRLERIEQAVETTAIEVERMAEANRFLTKLLAEKADAVPR